MQNYKKFLWVFYELGGIFIDCTAKNVIIK